MLDFNKIYNGDSFELINQIQDNTLDLVLTDFPYGISFLGKHWDTLDNTFFEDIGKLLIPKMKAGSYLITTFTPRQDMLWRCLAGLERAGFTTKCSPLFWVYHSGFPKAGDIAKIIDKKIGVKGATINEKLYPDFSENQYGDFEGKTKMSGGTYSPESNMAKEWNGWKNFQLKPSVEIIIVVQKPTEKKTIVDQVLDNGHGAVNIDATRIPYSSQQDKEMASSFFQSLEGKSFENSSLRQNRKEDIRVGDVSEIGRYPANLIVSGNPLKGEETEGSGVGGRGDIGFKFQGQEAGFKAMNRFNSIQKSEIFDFNKVQTMVHPQDFGSPNRFYDLDRWAEKNNITLTENDSAFLDVPKPSNSEKEQPTDNSDRYDGKFPSSTADKDFTNKHPTIKPLLLFQYLLKMFTKENWLVLDPFAGSGTTGVACYRLNRRFILIEKELEYFNIAEKRINEELKQKKLI